MHRVRPFVLAALAAALLPIGTRPVHAQEAAPDPEAAATDETEKRLGFYFALSLERLSQLGQANAIGLRIDRPPQLGQPFSAAGDAVDGDFNARWDLGFKFGFRLRGNHGSIESSFFQWDESQDLLTIAGDGEAIANTLADPRAGYHEDIGRPGIAMPGVPDGQVIGFEAGILSEGAEPADSRLDGAEDVNFSGLPEFIRFATSDRIVGSMSTDYQRFDVDWVKPVKRLRRLTLESRLGLRHASLTQDMDLGYREVGSFAVYSDTEGLSGASEQTTMGCPRSNSRVDGDGDGVETTVMANEPDGDGFLNGDCDLDMRDEITSVETISEDRIIARIDTSGIGLKIGMDGRFDLSPKWRVVGAVAVTGLATDAEWRYREVFTSERDRYLNFIEWDFNGDGLYDNRDLDFDGDCNGRLPCDPDVGDNLAVDNTDPVQHQGGIDISTRMRTGILMSRVDNPLGTNANAFADGRLDIGDPVPESERNNDVHREVTLLRDERGESSGFTTMLDLHVGAEYQFSRFAHLGFGLRSSRWFDAGRFRTLANDVVAGRDPEVDGDFGASGAYVMITVVPR